LVLLKSNNEAYIYDAKQIQPDNRWEITYWGAHKGIQSIATVTLKSGLLGSQSNPHTVLVALSTHVSLFLHGKYELSRYHFDVAKSLSFGSGEYVNIMAADKTYRTKIGVGSTSSLVNDVFHILYKMVPIELYSSLVWDFVSICEGTDEWLVLENIVQRLISARSKEVVHKSAWDLLNAPKKFES
jgi:hypothetical protein